MRCFSAERVGPPVVHFREVVGLRNHSEDLPSLLSTPAVTCLNQCRIVIRVEVEANGIPVAAAPTVPSN